MTQHVVPSQLLLCPICGFNYIKIFSVEISAGSAPGSDPGVHIKAKYRCEGCPGGVLTIQFHKGQTFLERGCM